MVYSGDNIRLASGTVTAYTLLTTSSYLVTNWTRVSDMPASIDWLASQPEYGAARRFVPSLAVGSGKRVGKFNTVLSFFQLTTGMRNYIEHTLLSSNGIGAITCYIHLPEDENVFAVCTGELVSPYHADSDLTYTRVNDELDVNVQYGLRRLTISTIEVLSTAANTVLSANGSLLYVG
jgi:hypothetical protein